MTPEEVSAAMEAWLKKRRDENATETRAWETIDDLLGEVRDAGAVGLLPWEVVE